jgi:hypothetical protein
MKKIIVLLLILGYALSAQTMTGKVTSTEISPRNNPVIDTMSFQLPKVMSYIILSADTSIQLMTMVNEKLTAGWQPVGGVAVMVRSFYQVMVLYK